MEAEHDLRRNRACEVHDATAKADEILRLIVATFDVFVDEHTHTRRIATRLLLLIGPEIRLVVHDRRLVEHRKAFVEQDHLVPVGTHVRRVGENRRVRLAARSHRIHRVHRRRSVSVRGRGENVDEQAARIPIGPTALAGKTDEVRVVHVHGDAERVRTILVVIGVQVVAHPDQEVRRATEFACDVRLPCSCRCPIRSNRRCSNRRCRPCHRSFPQFRRLHRYWSPPYWNRNRHPAPSRRSRSQRRRRLQRRPRRCCSRSRPRVPRTTWQGPIPGSVAC